MIALDYLKCPARLLHPTLISPNMGLIGFRLSQQHRWNLWGNGLFSGNIGRLNPLAMGKSAKDFFLKKTEDAMKRAKHCKAPEEKEVWLQIAEDYLRLCEGKPKPEIRR